MSKHRLLSIATLLLLALPAAAEDNPPADGFDMAGSDPEAVAIADEVMQAMGGRGAWDGTRYLSWRFFAPPPNGRRHVWDKWTGWVRFESGDDVTLVNIWNRDGRVWKDGAEVTDETARAEGLKTAYEAWINDSYWLLMPYKLKDSGVTLKYTGEGTTDAGNAADVITMTFKNVGVTPQNKYDVWVGKDSRLVEQWAYYMQADNPEPNFKTPWGDWTRHGNIMLSGDRGRFRLTEIEVHDELPETVFESPDPIDL